MHRRYGFVVAALSIAALAVSAGQANIIDGEDGRDSLLTLGPSLGLSAAEIQRVRQVSGYVGCLSPSPSVGSGALFLTNDQVLTAGHIFFEITGGKRSNCFFRAQTPGSPRIDLLIDRANARFGGHPPQAGSGEDYAVVRLAEPLAGAEPFPVDPGTAPQAGDRLIEISAHPVGMEHIDRQVPVAQQCSIRRVPISSGSTNFFRTDCDATGSSSGAMHLSRVDGRLIYRGMTISTGPWRDPGLRGAPYNEKRGSVTTALGTDAAILSAGVSLAEAGR